ncbi:MAG: lipoate protein ligase C-terminal domain-containing protein [Promethearchaeota archaeon]
MNWRLLDLNGIPPLETQAIFHTVAQSISEDPNLPNTLILCYPEEPLVSCGYHQVINEEVDLKRCQKKKIPVVRRYLGGGAVYLDSDQLFYQVINRQDTPGIPSLLDQYYRYLLKAPIATYQRIGIPAEFAPVNDIVVEGKKISGNGAGQIEQASVLTGNLIFDFNFDEMVKILKVPSEKFRDKVAKSLRERLTTIKNELIDPPPRESIKEILIEEFEKNLGVNLEQQNSLTSAERSLLEEIVAKYLTSDWLEDSTRRHPEFLEKRHVKITAGSSIAQGVYKSPGGLIRLFIEIHENRIHEILISGDFSINPQKIIPEIEKSLVSTPIDTDSLQNTLETCFKENNIDSPGLSPSNLVKAILVTLEPRR